MDGRSKKGDEMRIKGFKGALLSVAMMISLVALAIPMSANLVLATDGESYHQSSLVQHDPI